MTKISMARGLLFAGVSAASLGLGSTALAQATPAAASPAGGYVLSDVVVTVEKRETDLQKTSVSVTALSGDDMREQGKTTPMDILKSVPGLELFGNGQNGSYPFIRGIGNAPRLTGDPSVTVSVNGVFIQRGGALQDSSYDVERVEVARGPQTTLTGRTAEGGSVSIITKAPQLGRFTGAATVNLGNLNLRTGEGVVNLPLGDKVAVRIAGSVAKRDPLVSDGTDGRDTKSGRVRVLFQPTDDLKLTLSGDYTQLDAPQSLVGSNTGLIDLSQPFRVTRGYYYSPSPNFSKEKFTIKNLYAEASYDFHWATLFLLPTYQVTTQRFELWTTNETTYRTGLTGGFNDAAAYARATNYSSSNSRSEQKTMEVRLNSPSDQRLVWLAGFYYFTNTQRQTTGAVAGSSSGAVPATATPLFPRGVVLPIYGDSTNRSSTDHDVFGQATYKFTDDWRLVLGGRYSQAERSRSAVPGFALQADGVIINTNQFIPKNNNVAGTTTAGAPAGALGIPSNSFKTDLSPRHDKYDAFNYKIVLEHDLTPDSMVYANVSTGWKSGSSSFIVNDTDLCPIANGCVAAVPIVAAGFSTGYKPSHLTAYEIGSKNKLLDGRLRMNLAAFYYDYKNYQFDYVANYVNPATGADPDFTATLTSNAKKATSYGAEMDASLLVTEADKVDLAIAYTHARIKELGVPSTATAALKAWSDAMSGQPMQRSPDWSINPAYSHRFTFSNGSVLEVGASGTYRSSQTIILPSTTVQLANPSYWRQGAYWKYDAQATFTPENGRWSVTAYIHNITDEITFTGITIPSTFSTIGSATFYPSDPKTYGVILSANF